MSESVDFHVAAEHAPMQFAGNELEFWSDPHVALRIAREHHPLAWLQTYSAWLVLRYADVEALLSDRRLASDYGGLADGALGRAFSGFFANQQGATDGRRHTALGAVFAVAPARGAGGSRAVTGRDRCLEAPPCPPGRSLCKLRRTFGQRTLRSGE